jgi:apolipoprotein N-acyltransferase
MPTWAQGAFLAFAIALGALAVREPDLAIAGWISVAMAAWGMARWRASGWGLVGLVLGGAIGVWVAMPWAPSCYLAAGGPGWAWVAAAPTTAAWALLSRAPVAAAWRLLGARLPVWLWLPPAWLLGERCLEGAAGLQNDAWLYGQWQVEPVLRTLALVGWGPTLMACLLLASAVGAASAGSRAAIAVACAALVGFAALPARPTPDSSVLARVGAVHMTALEQRPRRAPEGLDLLVWPEEVATRRPRLPEGAVPAEKYVRAPAMRPGMRHLLGAHVRVPSGMAMNAILAIEPNGRVRAMRGKRALFPLVERPFLGLLAPGREAMEAGTAPATFDLGGTRVGALVCLEGFDRALAAEVRAAGARLIAISANDALLGGSAIGHRQMLGVTVLRAVESRLPIARSTMYGRASLVAADGRVLAWSAPDETGVLRLTEGIQAAKP